MNINKTILFSFLMLFGAYNVNIHAMQEANPDKKQLSTADKIILEKLIETCKEGYIYELKGFIEDGLDINKYGIDPLFAALVNKNEEIVKLLIASYNKDTLNMPYRDGITALHMACNHGDFEIVKLLVEKGVDVNATADFGQTPLYLAKNNNFPKIEKFLLQHEASETIGFLMQMLVLQQKFAKIINLEESDSTSESDSESEIKSESKAKIKKIERKGKERRKKIRQQGLEERKRIEEQTGKIIEEYKRKAELKRKKIREEAELERKKMREDFRRKMREKK